MATKPAFLIALTLTAAIGAGTAWADPPRRGDHGRPEPHARHDDRGRRGPEVRFRDNDHVTIRNYYGPVIVGGRCPPGLAKKGNACVPPGHAKRWAVGRPLPRDVVFYDLPPALVVQLGPPPPHHRYVRVGADILMIAIGTGLVVDAIVDLGRM
jgi:Ni/Co efflux regulator RcnB